MGCRLISLFIPLAKSQVSRHPARSFSPTISVMKDLRCPLCHHLLLQNTQGLACDNRHQFDRAKEGYFNLLPVQHKHSREPGDAKEQLQARREFLQAGFFEPLREHLQKLLPSTAETVLDIGCGEGYFTSGFSEVVPNATVYGIDIAKAGVRLASKAAKGSDKLIYCVASSAELPVADESIDLVTRIYAPSKDGELWRVIKPAGKLVIVAPGENHLFGLRSRIYKEVRPHPLPAIPVGFGVVSQQRLTTELTVTEPALRSALLGMTPFAWRMTSESRESILATELNDNLDFVISVYSKI
jgi:23S rRNA (guanine745-N1)-methyltransferase